MSDRYDPERDITPAFLERVFEWIENARVHGDGVLVVLRYLRAAGAKDFALCFSERDFRALVEAAPRGCDIVVFRDPQLPIRGLVNDKLIASALAAIPDGAEYLLIARENTRRGSVISRDYEAGESHGELLESLREFDGVEVALGIWPELYVADHEGMISASKGGIDGPR